MGALAKLEELNRLYERMVVSYMELHRDDLEVKDLSMAAYVIVQAVEALCHHAVLERPDVIVNGKLEEQLVRLLIGYVKPSLLLKRGHTIGKKQMAVSA